MILCPKRKGLWGVNHINKVFLGHTFDIGVTSWPQGTPVMCGENQPELNLANGDIGIVIGEGKSRRLLFPIATSEGNITTTLVHPARLKLVEPALALTIHKAQGSEANRVILLWPDEINQSSAEKKESIDNTNYSTRLLYTAITRAKKQLDLIIHD